MKRTQTQKDIRNIPTFAYPFSFRALSSVGSEHLPYKQRVAGSNPAEPTLGNSRVTNTSSPCIEKGTTHKCDYGSDKIQKKVLEK